MDTGADGHPVVLFDGVCNLCNAAVNFIIDRDPRGVFRFAALQSAFGERELARLGIPPPAGDPETILLVENGRVHARSTAALRISRRLSGLWPLLALLVVVPRPVRDAVYGWVARNRYRWFGRTSDVCRVPTPELRARFLE